MMKGHNLMMYIKREATNLVKLIDSLEEPYRQNTITWLEMFVQRPMIELSKDIEIFLNGLDPVMRTYFLNHARKLLQTAVKSFSTETIRQHSQVGGVGEAQRVPSGAG
jgi:hypothetical protein